MKEKADCCIGGPTRTISDTMGEFTTSVQDEKTYTFSNVRVQRVQVPVDEYKWMLGTSLYNCTMSEIQDLPKL